MTAKKQIEYFKKSATAAPSIAVVLEPPEATEETTDAIIKEAAPSSFSSLVNQNIINIDKYRKNKATRRVIGHVRFEPD
jgi:ABC-type uncharacterized transport system substrate-binding protein